MDSIILLTAYHICLAHTMHWKDDTAVVGDTYPSGYEQCVAIVAAVNADNIKRYEAEKAAQKTKDLEALDRASQELKAGRACANQNDQWATKHLDCSGGE